MNRLRRLKQQIEHYYNLFVIVFLGLIGISYIPLFMRKEILDAFAREDRIYETLTAIYFLLTSTMFIIFFLYSRFTENLGNNSKLKAISYVGLALLFFVAGGEEISWGERIFSIEHNYINDMNVQNELNFHNLKYFQGEEAILPLSISQLGIVFMFIFGLFIPFVCDIYEPLRRRIKPIFPVMPFKIGLLIAANYLIQKLLKNIIPLFPNLYQHSNLPVPAAIHEIREHGFAFAMLIITIFYFFLNFDFSNPVQEKSIK